jgi:hypothetical protein
MTNLEDEVNRAVQRLLTQIVDLARHAAVDSLNTALDRSTGNSFREGPGLRRSSAELASLADRVEACVRANPGLHIEQISQHLGTTSGQLRVPLHRLIVDRVIVTKGKQRGRTYYVRSSEARSPGIPPLPLPGLPASPPVGHSLLRLTDPAILRFHKLAVDDGDQVDADWSRCLTSVFAFARKLNA